MNILNYFSKIKQKPATTGAGALKLLIAMAVAGTSVQSATAATDAGAMLQQFGLEYDINNTSDPQAKYAMELQRRLMLDVPIYYTSFLGTHNSYNSEAYNIDLWPQQEMTVKGQMNEGVEWIELDVHHVWTTGLDLNFCHGEFCYLDSVNSHSILDDLREWAEEMNEQNTTRTAVIYIESDLEDSEYYTDLRNQLNSRVGAEHIYTPTDYKNDFPGDANVGADKATSFPESELTRQHLLNKGKRYVIYFSGYSGSDNHNVLDWIFENPGSLNGSRVWEKDGYPTSSSTLNITGSDLIGYWQDGKSVIGLHDVHTDDGRFRENAQWSWNDGEPNDAHSGEDCAELRTDYADNRWNDAACSNSRRAACKWTGGDLYSKDNSVIYNLWSLSATSTTWAGAEQACQTLGSGWNFEVPRNAIENAVLAGIADEAGETKVWLNYTDSTQEGVFTTPSQR
ncbi:lectin-like protein [Thalassomonas sp. RHCl1]|uniref:lectin-like protein n=1 Tax=Thalassomonas sp. RHCl1 TaxID=2995320 RepID=UPI00248B43B9|nr:lectin-like protein [Thalassomonas sp. RHCl1]